MLDKIKYHRDKKKYFWCQREVAKGVFEKSHGYVIGFSKAFILLQDSDDFELDGYSIFPIRTIAEIKYGNSEKHYDKIMRSEGVIEQVHAKHKIILTDWTSIFKSIKSLGLNAIIENEDPDAKSFDIGPLTKVTKTSVYIRYFDSKGYLNEEPTKIPFNQISNVRFDGRYVNTMSKYLREKKSTSVK